MSKREEEKQRDSATDMSKSAASSGLRRSKRVQLLQQRVECAPLNAGMRALFDPIKESALLSAATASQKKELAAGALLKVRKGRRTLELVHSSPNVFQIRDFLSPNETAHFVKLVSNSKLKRSFTDTSASGPKIISSERTSSFTFVGKAHDSVVRRVEERVASILSLSTWNIEPFQLLRYGCGQRFGLHHDSGTLQEAEDGSYEVQLCEPKRVVTIFVYLNTLEPECGGQTDFPLCGVCAKPESGKAVIWCNVQCDDSSVADERVIHSAKPVVGKHSLKYGLNIWVDAKPFKPLI